MSDSPTTPAATAPLPLPGPAVPASPAAVRGPALLQNRSFRRVALALAAVLFAAVLAFLYFKTQGVDYRKHGQVLGHLRALRDLDARWNDEALKSMVEPAGTEKREGAAAAFARLYEPLQTDAVALGPSLAASLPGLKAAFEQKAAALARLRTQNLEQTRAAAAAHETLDRLQERLRARGAAKAEAEKLALIEGDLTDLEAATFAFLADPREATAAHVASRMATLEQRAESAPEPAAAAVRAVTTELRRLVALRQDQVRALEAFGFLTAGERTASLSRSVERQFQEGLDQAEVYRTFLVYYALALLVLLGHVGVRLRESYRVISRINDELKVANESLEHRVQERTRELSDALAHLKESETLLIQSEKMSSLGQMVAGIVHEINTPLAYVKNSMEAVAGRIPQIGELVDECKTLLDMLQTGSAGEEQVAAQFAKVALDIQSFREREVGTELGGLTGDGLHGIGQIAEIVTNLKDFSRLDRSKVTAFDLQEGLESALLIAKHLVKHKTVKKTFGKLPRITCSPSQINQVFLNLITNAAQATPDDEGVIYLRTAMRGPDHVIVQVADNGHGIPEDVLPKIFDPFFTTKDVGKGTGLGLSISYKIVQAHGGTIKVATRAGVGSRFTVVLPVAAPAEAAGLEEAA